MKRKLFLGEYLRSCLRGAVLVVLFVLFCPRNVVFPQRSDTHTIESLEFREVEIKDVLRQLAKQYGLNIVFSEAVKGQVTVQLNDISIDEALDSIITVNGFTYIKKDKVIKVMTPEELLHEGKQTKLITLNNADASKLKDSLKRVLSSDGAIEVDSRSNSLVVTDSLQVIHIIEGMIPDLDKITPQILIEAKLIETSLTKEDKLGIDWITTISASGSKRPTTLPFNANSDMGMAANLPMSSPTASGSVGVFPSVGTAPPLSGSPYSFPYAIKGDFTLGTLDFSSLKAVFDLLKTRQNTKLVANPRIVTLNNQKATINVGKVLSLPLYERNETTGNMEITGWERYNVGVILEVVPQVSSGDRIKLKIKPEVSNLIGYASNRNGVNEGPITSTRTAETEVQINDGQTVVIGGLVKEESLTVVKKIPLLGDIPFLGALFTRKEVGSSSNPNEKTDLLIFVTARIIKDTNEQLVVSEGEATRPFKLKMRNIR
jgi:type IV pilus secretin PilQ/predicted competence protein